MRDHGGPAFPSSGAALDFDHEGMLLRDYFAAQAMQSFNLDHFSKYGTDEHRNSVAAFVAESAYIYADAMIAERNK